MSASRPLALVTGASSGIGFELARLFAENGFDLVVNAENAGIETAAQELRATGVDVVAVQADLTRPEEVDRLFAETTASGRPVAAAALNAGVGHGGSFVENELAAEVEIINLNVTSIVHLSKLLLRDMVARNEGRVLVTSSIVSTMPGAFHAVYNASKSFVQSLVEAVQNELKDTDVVITSLMPGPTDTDFFHRAELDDTRLGKSPKDAPAQVAQQGFDALMAGKDKVVGGSLKMKAMALGNSVLPDQLKSEAHRQLAEPGSGC